jgi:uncharacterized protein YcfJ
MQQPVIVTERKDENRDPLSGALGAHPVGAGVGATGGGLAGAAIGAVGGPIGAGIGIVAGAVVGGLAGKAAAEGIDPTVEETYWRSNFVSRPYVTKGESYDTYHAAYQTGYENHGRYKNRRFDEIEKDLRSDYEGRVGASGMSWEKAKHATRDAWQRVEDYLPGDANKNGH